MEIKYFGHNNITRKAIVAFMDLFDQIYIEKYRENKPAQLIRVPIQFANREKYLEDLQTVSVFRDHDGDLAKVSVEYDIILPRMSFNIMSMTYDSQRRIHKTHKLCNKADDGTNKFVPVPWNLELELSILSKTMDDGLQIIEQIMPFFGPSRNINLQIFDEFESESIPITLTSVTPTIEEELAPEDQRFFTFLLTFSMKINYHLPPVISKKVKRVNTNLYIVDSNDEYATRFLSYEQNAVVNSDVLDSVSGDIYAVATDGTSVYLTAPGDAPVIVDPTTGIQYRLFINENREFVITEYTSSEVQDDGELEDLQYVESDPVAKFYLADQILENTYYKLKVVDGLLMLTELTEEPAELDTIQSYDPVNNITYEIVVENGVLTPIPVNS